MSRTPRTDFGNRLVQSRKRAKLTQEQLATLVGMAQCTLSFAERLALSSTHTAQLARVLGVNSAWLATGEGSWDDGLGGEGAGLDLFTQPPKVEAADVQPESEAPLSPLAHEVGAMFDLLLSDRIKRSRGYNLATQLFLDLHSEVNAEGAAAPAGAPSDTPGVPARACPETQHR